MARAGKQQVAGQWVEVDEGGGRRPVLRCCLNIASVVRLAASVKLVAFSLRVLAMIVRLK